MAWEPSAACLSHHGGFSYFSLTGHQDHISTQLLQIKVLTAPMQGRKATPATNRITHSHTI